MVKPGKASKAKRQLSSLVSETMADQVVMMMYQVNRVIKNDDIDLVSSTGTICIFRKKIMCSLYIEAMNRLNRLQKNK